MAELEEFTKFLFKKDSGYVYTAKKAADLGWVQEFFSWPFESTKLHDWIRTNSLDSDVYLSPVLFSEKKVSKATVKISNVVWVEFDGQADLNLKGLPEPSYTIQSSTESHKHLYWAIDGGISNESIEETNRRLTYYLGADSSGWDITQVLRPPETINYAINKNQPVLPVKVISSHTEKFSIESFDAAPIIAKPVLDITYTSLLDLQDVLKELKLPQEISNRVLKEIPTVVDRSTFMMHTGHLLAEAGASHLQIVTLMYEMDHRLKKFVGRQDQLIRLSEIASFAILKRAKTGFQLEYYTPTEVINFTETHVYLIPDWLHSTGMMFISGAPGVGKTQLALQMAYHLSTGTSIFKKEITEEVEVLFMSLEMDIPDLQYIFTYQTNSFELQDKWNLHFKSIYLDDYSHELMESIVQKLEPRVIIIDSLSELIGDMKEEEARKVMQWLKYLRKKYSLAIILIHHNRKASDTNKKPNKLSDLYGSYLFAAKSETVLSLWQDEAKPESPLDLSVLKSRFGKKIPLLIKRTTNLTFDLIDIPLVLPNSAAELVNPLLGIE